MSAINIAIIIAFFCCCLFGSINCEDDGVEGGFRWVISRKWFLCLLQFCFLFSVTLAAFLFLFFFVHRIPLLRQKLPRQSAVEFELINKDRGVFPSFFREKPKPKPPIRNATVALYRYFDVSDSFANFGHSIFFFLFGSQFLHFYSKFDRSCFEFDRLYSSCLYFIILRRNLVTHIAQNLIKFKIFDRNGYEKQKQKKNKITFVLFFSVRILRPREHSSSDVRYDFRYDMDA